ncbi:MAG: hypothetical protein AAB388_04395 [Patescibacteria group bacterium]
MFPVRKLAFHAAIRLMCWALIGATVLGAVVYFGPAAIAIPGHVPYVLVGLLIVFVLSALAGILLRPRR